MNALAAEDATFVPLVGKDKTPADIVLVRGIAGISFIIQKRAAGRRL
jgi:hypothetical protein